MTYVRETIVTTKNIDNSIKISPLGIYIDENILRIKPFKPSISLDNILRNKSGVINYVDDVRVFASCIVKNDIKIELTKVDKIDCSRIKSAVSHTEFIIDHVKDDNLRPTIICKPVNEEIHRMYYGLNRAKSAVLELCILASRLGIIDDEKIKNEIKYLNIAIEKTAGRNELEAWKWLNDYINTYRKNIK
tara:strand:+ start:916 stop:1485 length:570 start_codon:yes stop_codon:yes gene_type:complete